MSKDKYNRFAWRDDVFADTEVSASVKCLAHGMAKFINHETGEAVVGTRALAEVCGNSQTWATKTIPLLAATGWLQVLRKGRPGSGPNSSGCYKMNRKREHPVCSHQDGLQTTPREHFWPSREHTGYSEPLNHQSAPPARSSEFVTPSGVSQLAASSSRISSCGTLAESAPAGASAKNKQGITLNSTDPFAALNAKLGVDEVPW